jgi:hypothetical protein
MRTNLRERAAVLEQRPCARFNAPAAASARRAWWPRLALYRALWGDPAAARFSEVSVSGGVGSAPAAEQPPVSPPHRRIGQTTGNMTPPAHTHRLYSRLDARHDATVRCVEAALLRALLVTAVRQRRPDKVRGGPARVCASRRGDRALAAPAAQQEWAEPRRSERQLRLWLWRGFHTLKSCAVGLSQAPSRDSFVEPALPHVHGSAKLPTLPRPLWLQEGWCSPSAS